MPTFGSFFGYVMEHLPPAWRIAVVGFFCLAPGYRRPIHVDFDPAISLGSDMATKEWGKGWIGGSFTMKSWIGIFRPKWWVWTVGVQLCNFQKIITRTVLRVSWHKWCCPPMATFNQRESTWIYRPGEDDFLVPFLDPQNTGCTRGSKGCSMFNMRLSINRGTPKTRWIVVENPNLKYKVGPPR